MVLGVVSIAGDVFVHFFKAGEKINTYVYLGVQRRLFSLGWMKGLWDVYNR
ncbi:Hypothetical protein FKW44_015562, partial [Caligus rogercresseyi]